MVSRNGTRASDEFAERNDGADNARAARNARAVAVRCSHRAVADCIRVTIAHTENDAAADCDARSKKTIGNCDARKNAGAGCYCNGYAGTGAFAHAGSDGRIASHLTGRASAGSFCDACFTRLDGE